MTDLDCSVRMWWTKLLKGELEVAYRDSGFLAVKEEDLPKTPAAFQKYVEKYFKKVEMFGESVFVAATTGGSINNYGGAPRKGVAPSHIVNLSEFGKEGLPEGFTNLRGWIDEESRKENSMLFEFEVSWNDCRKTEQARKAG